MWEKDFSNVNYFVVKEEKNPLHFYLIGDDFNLLQETSSALVDNLNQKKKSDLLRIEDRIGEYCILKSGIRMGVTGMIQKATEISDNSERREFLKKTIKKF